LVLLLIPRLGAGTSVCLVCSGSTVTPLSRLARGNHRNEGNSVPFYSILSSKWPSASFWALASKERLIVPFVIITYMKGIFLPFFNKLELSLDYMVNNLFLETMLFDFFIFFLFHFFLCLCFHPHPIQPSCIFLILNPITTTTTTIKRNLPYSCLLCCRPLSLSLFLSLSPLCFNNSLSSTTNGTTINVFFLGTPVFCVHHRHRNHNESSYSLSSLKRS